MSLLDQSFLWPGILSECLILFILAWGPVASELWMLRAYLCFSLTRSAVLVAIDHSALYVPVFQVATIIGHVLLMLVAVELMACLINDSKVPVAYFYSLAVAALLISALSELKFPLTLSMGQIAIFTIKASALTGFLLSFTLAFAKRCRWPYTGFAFGLAVMMAMTFAAVIARNWSAGHGWQHYSVIRYAFPLASDTGYFLWLWAIFNQKERINPQQPFSAEEAKKMLQSYKAAVGDLIKRRAHQ